VNSVDVPLNNQNNEQTRSYEAYYQRTIIPLSGKVHVAVNALEVANITPPHKLPLNGQFTSVSVTRKLVWLYFWIILVSKFCLNYRYLLYQ